MPAETILRVAVPAPIFKTFDYLPPENCTVERPVPGMRVLVPFGRGSRCGVVLEVVSSSEIDRFRLKRAASLPDHEPLLQQSDLDLLRWAAGYYQHPVGEVVASALPARLRRGEPVIGMAEKVWRRLDGRESADELRRAPVQRAILGELSGMGGEAADSLLRERFGNCRESLSSLEKKGWIVCEERLPVPGDHPRGAVESPELNAEQQQAVDAVAGADGGFATFLLDGVTGSGKTEVYLRLVQRQIEQGRQTLVLVPEIGLTPQLLRRFRKRVGECMAVLHSGLSDAERERAWHLARMGRAQVVLGTRSALFTPMPRLGLVIMDEEHDLSYKQQEGFRYSARDMVVLRARQASCPVLLGSATPSLESLHNCETGRFQRLALTARAGGASAPRMDLLDIRTVRLDAGLSPVMKRMVAEELEAGNQVLIFLNRRGYAPVVTCHACGWMAQCRRCDARMTLHAASKILWCHHCGSQRPLDRCCPECGESDLRALGQGTERLGERLSELFPGHGLVRIDRDTTRRKGSLDRLLGEIREGRHSLLLGTQMLSKGHHFPDVTLVGILDVDQGLFGADFRAAERMAQQIVQVAGRAGRSGKPGRVLIQTRHPDHPMMQTLVREGYGAFAAEAMRERREVHYPPFSYQALLRAQAPKEEEPRRFLDEAAELARQGGVAGIELWGPVPAPMERRAGRYRAHLLLQSTRRAGLQALLRSWVPGLADLPSARRVRWSIDVDPQEMF